MDVAQIATSGSFEKSFQAPVFLVQVCVGTVATARDVPAVEPQTLCALVGVSWVGSEMDDDYGGVLGHGGHLTWMV